MVDTQRYIEEATYWQQGQSAESYHFWYSGYILLLLINKVLFSSYSAIVVLQMVFSILALLSCYQALKTVTAANPALFSCLFVVLYLPIQQWNVYLLTESLYISSLLFLFSAFLGVFKKWTWLFILISSYMIISLRPNGFTIILAILCAWTFFKIIKKQNKWPITLFLFICFSIVIWLVQLKATVFATFIQNSFSAGEIICGYVGHTIPTNYETLPITDNAVALIIKMLFNNPLATTKLVLWKLFYLIFDVRPYYTFGHNLFILAFLIPFYLLCFYGIVAHFKKQYYQAVVILFFVLFNVVIVLISYVDWDGRFLAPLLVSLVFTNAFGTQRGLNFLLGNDKT